MNTKGEIYGKEWEKSLKTKGKDFLVHFIRNLLKINQRLEEYKAQPYAERQRNLRRGYNGKTRIGG